ncbi:hypothetical protein Esi_0067_0087 [Ectocarpus siliculosus]|uniref:Uncharacterized protein n=1 Tax=Ectocarpus siliculosus TaxID=2880 RepID=D7G5T4_ECTSI|nr:hypothetical protein Esi_0067_0087 [Ectocarpus siliculosus]|eukprot:CBJ27381.1 hypothetical protein Esi_0067_0087 [Ectocarpus siliculosus]
MAALSKWPTTCYSNTLMGMDLIIYRAEASTSASRLTTVPDRASLCFRDTKIVAANLRPEARLTRTATYFRANAHFWSTSWCP